MRYELFYLVGASKEADLTRIREEVKNIVTENGGKFEEKETQEKRKLSYQIKHEVQGIYIAQRFELEDKDKLTEINSKLNLHNDVLRFILSRADELPELKSKEERIKLIRQRRICFFWRPPEADDKKQKFRQRKPWTEGDFLILGPPLPRLRRDKARKSLDFFG